MDSRQTICGQALIVSGTACDTSMDVPSQQPPLRRSSLRPAQVLKTLVEQPTPGPTDLRSRAEFSAGSFSSSRSNPVAANSNANTVRLVTGHAGDHALVHALLRAANQAPSYEDFVTWLDEPTYEPTDRLLIKQGERIVAHLHLLTRTAWFDGVRVPVGTVQDLAVLPEYALAGYVQLLVCAAEQVMRESQAVVAIARTTRPEPFRAAGWIDARGQGHSEIGVNDLIAHLAAQPSPTSRRMRGLRIRRWRHVELEAVRAVYSNAAAHLWGALDRSDAYWQWLIGRNAHTDLIVAVEGDDELDKLQTPSRIVGYVVMHGPQLLELFCLPEFARSAPRLLVRACQDAIERDHHTLAMYTPASDPLHELVVTAGGTWSAQGRAAGPSLMLKLLDPPRWIEDIYPVLNRRAKRSGLPRPLQLCFDAHDEQFRLVITRRKSRLVADEAMRADVHCDKSTFAALLLGNLNITKACAAGRLTATDEETLRCVAALFPPSLFWQSQFDALRF
jgi:predicted acetyltransferase